jgi:predicted nucleic acid-binding protein
MVVVDANLFVALVSGDPRGDLILKQFIKWIDTDIELHAPMLARYEIANALTRLVVAGAFQLDKVEAAWSDLSLLPVTYHALENTQRTVEIALSLGRQTAYDAVYIELAERLRAELWTMDGPLYRNAVGLHFPVRHLG